MIETRIAAILLSGGLLVAAGCANTGENQARTDGDRTTVAESTQTADSTVSPSDAEFVMEAARGGMAEVKIGQLAAQRATNPQVKDFAQRMVQDHSQANNELQGLAQAKNIALPPDMGDAYRQELERLSQLTGPDFDRAYMDRMVDEHAEDVELFQQQAQRGRDADLKTWAAKTLPTLQSHQELARSIDSAIDR
jgi:putative membrane protein